MQKKLSKIEINALLGFQARDREIAKVAQDLRDEYQETLNEICQRLDIKPEELGTRYNMNLDNGLVTEIQQPPPVQNDVDTVSEQNN